MSFEGKHMYQPKISIVIPAYNASNYLAEAIDCALAQTYPNTEIIVVNDGSKDDGATERIAMSYGDKIRYIYKENGGSSSALNVGIANMTGEWFSWLSHDDLYVPEKLEKQVEYMRSLNVSSTNISEHIFFSASEWIDAMGNTIKKPGSKRMEAIAEKMRSISHNRYLIAEPTANCFYGCSCLVHKDIFAKFGGFDENLRLLNDIDLWFRLYAGDCKVHYYPSALVKCRIHPAQISRRIGYSYHNPEQDMYWNRSLDWLIENYPEDDSLFLLFARNAYLKTRNAEADKAFSILISLVPEKKVLMLFRRFGYKLYAKAWNLAKQLILRMRT